MHASETTRSIHNRRAGTTLIGRAGRPSDTTVTCQPIRSAAADGCTTTRGDARETAGEMTEQGTPARIAVGGVNETGIVPL